MKVWFPYRFTSFGIRPQNLFRNQLWLAINRGGDHVGDNGCVADVNDTTSHFNWYFNNLDSRLEEIWSKPLTNRLTKCFPSRHQFENQQKYGCYFYYREDSPLLISSSIMKLYHLLQKLQTYVGFQIQIFCKSTLGKKIVHPFRFFNFNYVILIRVYYLLVDLIFLQIYLSKKIVYLFRFFTFNCIVLIRVYYYILIQIAID